jgi:hypothetical protein
MHRLVAAGHDSSVHVPDGSGYPGGLVGEQVDDCCGHVFGLADFADGVEGVEALQGFCDLSGFDEGLIDWGWNDGGRDRVDANVWGASTMAKCWVRECSPAFAMEYAEEGIAATA